MWVSILGPVSVRRDGTEVDLGPRVSRLLAALTVRAGSVVSMDRLVDIVWQCDPPPRAEASLKTYVTRLRQILGPDVTDRIVFRRPGYQLELGIDELDSRSFESDLELARQQLRLAEDWCQADALRVLPEFRAVMTEELGIDVAPDLVELEMRIARRDPSLRSARRALRGYELGETIGEVAFAVVHRGIQPGIERDVAIKIIRAELADRPEFARRFEHEARLVARHEHPAIVPIFDCWRQPGAAYLVMRLIRGGNAEAHVHRHGPFSRRAVVRLATQVGSALEHAHRHDVVHRDVRPANLLLDEDGNAYLSDFGIARPTGDVFDGELLSPAYSAPEVLRGQPAGPAADVLGFGVTVFELPTGRLPFAESTDRAELVRHQLDDPLPPVRAVRTDLPLRVDEVLARATAKVPEDRYRTVSSFVADLRIALDESDAVVGALESVESSVRDHRNPYVGLHAFDEADAPYFHGRAALVGALADALSRRSLLVVVGASGSGKSSVVRAGLLPAVRRGAVPGSENWVITTMTPG